MLLKQRNHVNADSTGTLVLSEDTSEQVDMGDHRNMLLGAMTGTTVQYGTEGTTEALRSLNLGGSGTLVVHYVLSGQDTLTVDGRGNRTGEVQLRRIADDFSGTLHVKSEGGRMVLNAGDTCSLSNAVANIGNGGVLKANHLSVSGNQSSVELYGALEYDTLTVKDGATLNLRTNGRLDTEHAATIAEGGIMRLNAQTLQDKVELKNGGIMYGNVGITKDGLGTLHLNNAANSYTGTTTVNGGVLRSAVAGALGTSALVINDNGTAELSGTDAFKNHTTVNKGGTLRFAASDALRYSKDGSNNKDYSQTLIVDGGLIDFGSTRQTMAKWNLTLKNGAEIKGEGGTYNNTAYSAALDFNHDNTITAEGAGNLISANIRLNGGNSRTLTYQVAENADLEVSGRMHADTTGALGKVTKDGAGKLILSGQTMLNLLNTKGGEVVIAYTGADGNTIGGVDGSMSGGTTANGTLRIAENAKLKVTGGFWSRPNTGILLEERAELNMSAKNMVFSNRTDSVARLTALENGTRYEYTSDKYELTNGHAKYTGTKTDVLKNRLTNSSVENAGSGKLTVDNAANSITDVYASAGDMAIMQQAAGLNLEELVVASQKTVSAYTGTSATATAEANVTIHGHAEFGKGAVLNANLTLASGSSLQVAEGGLTMGSTLSLQKGITLDDATLKRVYSLNTGESVVLFTGVDGLELGKQSYTSISANDEILASPYFSNLNSAQYRLTYTGTDNGTLAIISAAVPEPATATLSLLALAALAARRRRK